MLTLTFLLLVATSLSAQNGGAGDLPCGAECAGCAHGAQKLGTLRWAPGDTEAAAHPATASQQSGWDGPSCTEDVSVSRGQCAVLSCSISNPLLNVTIHLKTPGKDFQPLFSVTPPGCFRQGGWQLQVRGGMAQLVIPEVSNTQAGWYRWHLQGLQRNVKNTTLNISGTEAPDLNQAGNTSSACSCGLQRGCSSGAAGQFQLVLVIVTVMLILLATTLLAWHQRHSPLYSKPPQV